MNKRWILGGAAAASALGLFGALARDAGAQRVDPRRPATFVVGAPGGPSPMERVDARRSGVARDPLPSGTLHVAWKKTLGLSVDQAALAGADGTIAIVTARGDVVFLDEDGEERAHVAVDARSSGPPAITSDGTVVFGTSTGDAIGVKRTLSRARYSTRLGGERNLRAAPLSLDDGGVVVATMSDLVVLDAEGAVRARTTLPESPAAPLLAAGDKVIAVSAAGTVFGWTPGREPARLGSFGAPVDGGVALDGGTLVGVVEGNDLVDVDIVHGTRGSRSLSQAGLYLGPPALRRVGGTTVATLLAMSPSRVQVVTVDAAGTETVRAPTIAILTPQVLADGGVAPLSAPAHTPPVVDARGAIAFASTDGHVGVVAPDGAVDVIGELLCTRTGRSSGIAGLTPFGKGAFIVTCEGGVVAKITGG